MDARYLLPLLALPLLLRRTDRPDSETPPHRPEKPPIVSIKLPPTFRKMSRRTARIDAIVLHCTEGGPDALQSALYSLLPVEKEGRLASFHNVIGRDGKIVQVVPWEMNAWHCRSTPGRVKVTWNNRSIGIEHCALPSQGLTPAQERASVQLIRYLLHRFRIPWQNVTAHRFTGANTSCPNSLWRTRDELERWKKKHFANEA